MGPLGNPELVIYPPLFHCWDRGLPYGLGLVPGRARQGGGVCGFMLRWLFSPNMNPHTAGFMNMQVVVVASGPLALALGAPCLQGLQVATTYIILVGTLLLALSGAGLPLPGLAATTQGHSNCWVCTARCSLPG